MVISFWDLIKGEIREIKKVTNDENRLVKHTSVLISGIFHLFSHTTIPYKMYAHHVHNIKCGVGFCLLFQAYATKSSSVEIKPNIKIDVCVAVRIVQCVSGKIKVTTWKCNANMWVCVYVNCKLCEKRGKRATNHAWIYRNVYIKFSKCVLSGKCIVYVCEWICIVKIMRGLKML